MGQVKYREMFSYKKILVILLIIIALVIIVLMNSFSPNKVKISTMKF